MALLVARASAAKRDLRVDDGRPNAALVSLPHGLPLAIELAAARVRVMTPGTLLERMSERFRLLTSSGGRHTRQETLRATVDWSPDLLTADERQGLAQVSVFEGGFTLEAAGSVLSLSEPWLTDAVQGLVDESWVRAVSGDRFDLLVSVQENAAEKLEAGERLVRQVGDPLWLGELLAARAWLKHAAGRSEVAWRTPAEADALARQVGAGPDSELGMALAQARAALETS